MFFESEVAPTLAASDSPAQSTDALHVVSSFLDMMPETNLPVTGVELIKQFAICHLEAYAAAAEGRHTEQTSVGKTKADHSSTEPSSANAENLTTPVFTYLAGWGSLCRKDGSGFEAGDKLTQAEANELLNHRLQQDLLPLLAELPRWDELNGHQQGALLSFAESLGSDLSAISPRSLLGRALRDRRWYQVPDIIRGYHGHHATEHIDFRREEEAALFSLEIRKDSYTLINRSRLLALREPALCGQDIQTLQDALVRRGYEIKADGTFGPMTQWAVEKFQQTVGLPITGIADTDTQRILYARALYYQKPNLIGSDIREVQSLLARIGYAVPVNGIFNLRTCEAVIAFQNYFGLPEDGIVRDRTLTQLLHLPALVEAS